MVQKLNLKNIILYKDLEYELKLISKDIQDLFLDKLNKKCTEYLKDFSINIIKNKNELNIISHDDIIVSFIPLKPDEWNIHIDLEDIFNKQYKIQIYPDQSIHKGIIYQESTGLGRKIDKITNRITYLKKIKLNNECYLLIDGIKNNKENGKWFTSLRELIEYLFEI